MRLACALLVVLVFAVVSGAAQDDVDSFVGDAIVNAAAPPKDVENFGQLKKSEFKTANNDQAIVVGLRDSVTGAVAQRSSGCASTPQLLANPPPLIMAPGPVANVVSRTLATSSLDPWRIGVLSVGSFFLLCGAVLVVVGVVKHCAVATVLRRKGSIEQPLLASDATAVVEKKVAPMNMAFFIVGGALVIVGAVMVALALALPRVSPVLASAPLGSAVRDGVSPTTTAALAAALSQFVPGYEMDFDRADVVADSVDGKAAGVAHWTLKFTDSRGTPLSVPLVAGLPQVTGDSTAPQQLPLAGSIISGRLRVAHNMRAVLLRFTVQRTQSQLVAQLLCPTNTKRVAFFVLNWGGQSCGYVSKPEPCTPACASLDVARGELNKVIRFWNEATEGSIAFTADPSKDVYSVTLPEGSFTNAEEIWDLLKSQKALFNPAWEQYDHRVYLFPANLLRGRWFSEDRGGFADMPGRESFLRVCHFRYISHELGHNLGFNHNGAEQVPSRSFLEYGDTAGVMGGMFEGVMRTGGPTVFNLFQMGLLPASKVLSVSGNGGYAINSVTSHRAPLGARVAIRGSAQHLWLEWRERRGDMDGDLAAAEQNTAIDGPMTGTLLVRVVRDPNEQTAMMTDLVASLAPGKSVKRSGVTITHDAATLGKFTVTYD